MIKIKSLFISDVHLGSRNSQADKLLEVFKKYEFDNLFIVGDFIDLTSLRRKFYWKEDHSTVIQKVLRLARAGICIRLFAGNHDYYLRGLIEEQDINIGNIQLCDSYIYESVSGKRIYILHGDQFDGFIRLHPILYLLGDKAYNFSIFINKFYNIIRKRFGFQYWSLSSYLKSKVKSAISFINDFKRLAIVEIKERNCDGILMGHIHSPSIENIDDLPF